MSKAQSRTPPRRGSGGTLVVGLVAGALLTLATPTALLGGVLLFPSLLTFWLDQVEGRPVLRAVLLFGLAGSAAPLLTLWGGGHSMEAALSSLSDVAVAATAWIAQAVGWLLAELMPLLIRLALDGEAAARAARLRASRGELEAEWGIQPLRAADASAVGRSKK